MEDEDSLHTYKVPKGAVLTLSLIALTGDEKGEEVRVVEEGFVDSVFSR